MQNVTAGRTTYVYYTQMDLLSLEKKCFRLYLGELVMQNLCAECLVSKPLCCMPFVDFVFLSFLLFLILLMS